MPKKDGVSATKEIRFFDENVIIFGVTASDAHYAMSEGKNSGMNDFLLKPFTWEDLKKLLEKYV